MKYILILLSFIIVVEFYYCFKRDCLGTKKEVTLHSCNWKGCDYRGLKELPVLYNPIDSVHFAHPTMEYDSAEILVTKL